MRERRRAYHATRSRTGSRLLLVFVVVAGDEDAPLKHSARAQPILVKLSLTMKTKWLHLWKSTPAVQLPVSLSYKCSSDGGRAEKAATAVRAKKAAASAVVRAAVMKTPPLKHSARAQPILVKLSLTMKTKWLHLWKSTPAVQLPVSLSYKCSSYKCCLGNLCLRRRTPRQLRQAPPPPPATRAISAFDELRLRRRSSESVRLLRYQLSERVCETERERERGDWIDEGL
uniref:Uncharacterized protein n=1 Tax=Oryza barthii TaxID=65489 RepID=A0A0D3G8E1_9ORYZ